MSTKAKLYRYFFNLLLNNGLLTCLFARKQKQQKHRTDVKQETDRRTDICTIKEHETQKQSSQNIHSALPTY